jgi:hypothetical protein
MLGVRESRGYPVRCIRLDLSNHQYIDYDLNDITAGIEGLKRQPLLLWGAALFILGLACEAIAFAIEYRE